MEITNTGLAEEVLQVLPIATRREVPRKEAIIRVMRRGKATATRWGTIIAAVIIASVTIVTSTTTPKNVLSQELTGRKRSGESAYCLEYSITMRSPSSL